MVPTLITIAQFLEKFDVGLRIGAFQRHFVWGQHRASGTDSVALLTDNLLTSFLSHKRYFLQSITVYDTLLVDGQQRVTFLLLLLRYLGYDSTFSMSFDNREEAQAFLSQREFNDIVEDALEASQDVYLYKRTLRYFTQRLAGIDRKAFLDFILNSVDFLLISLPDNTNVITIYRMMNGTKAPMLASDIIKADLMRIASDSSQPDAYDWKINSMRLRYAAEWNAWVRWWMRSDVREYYSSLGEEGVDLLLKLCLRSGRENYFQPVEYNEFHSKITKSQAKPYHEAKHFFHLLRQVQRRFEEAFTDAETYNRIRAIMLLQEREDAYRFLHDYFVDCTIDDKELVRYYKLSFLGLKIEEIAQGVSASERFDDLLASLSMADVYHSDTKRDVFNLLLRLNIDEDIKLGRKFDFSVWNNRSLEHIYSKSKVWHIGADGRLLDGNDNDMRMHRQALERDRSFMPRESIVNYDGTILSEHCIGNLVLLYGVNNASFGNASFEQKKAMFLSPGDATVFRSRNLLHSVCVFAGNSWGAKSIVDNYNLTLKNLKTYYGY